MLGSSLSGLLPTERGPTPFDGVAYFSWSLTEGLARAWSASCGHFQPVYYDRQCGMWHLCPLLSFFWIFHFDDLTRKELNGVISAGALGAWPGALRRPRCRHGEPHGVRLELRLRNLS